MNKDEIDLSVYPSYIGARADASSQERLGTSESVGRGLLVALLVGLGGVALGAVVARQSLVAVNLDTFTSALTSAAMVLLYARGAGAAPRRGLVPLLLLLFCVLCLSFAALMVSRAWWVYTLLDDELGMPMSRSSFIWGMFGDGKVFHWNLVFPFVMCGFAGTCLALWKVRRGTEG